MNKEEAISLMKTSVTLVQWNMNRIKVLNSFYAQDLEHEYPIFITHKCDKRAQKALLTSYVPQWFYGIIDGGFLLRETFPIS